MKFCTTLTVVLFCAAISLALTGLTVAVRAQEDRPTLEGVEQKIEDANQKLEDLLKSIKMPEKFQTKKFRLLWAREAYRCGNSDGAFNEWKALAEQGNREATYVLGLFNEWNTLADDGSLAAQYAMRLFRPGDGSAKSCKL